MGNLCGKQSDDNFSTPGRTVGSAPPQPRTASVPQSQANKASKPNTKPAPKVGGPPRTLGTGSDDSQTPAEARRKAAEAAEARASKGGKGGKLASNLAAQKKQTRVDTLKEGSAQNVAQRESDDNAKLRQYD